MGDTKAEEAALDAWYANADRIAGFLHSLNPHNWSLGMLRTMMRRHLDLTLTEAVDELTGNFARSVHDFDVVEHEILGMADTLTEGIIDQFPELFD